VDERARGVVRESLGRCAAGACGQTTVRRVVVGWTRLQRDGVGSGAACSETIWKVLVDTTISIVTPLQAVVTLTTITWDG
jgi:hypothetical protein